MANRGPDARKMLPSDNSKQLLTNYEFHVQFLEKPLFPEHFSKHKIAAKSRNITLRDYFRNDFLGQHVCRMKFPPMQFHAV